MKNIILISVFILTISSFAFAQSPLAEFNKAKEIKLLESTREDVKRILANYKADDEDAESFTAKNADIEVSYSTGCSEEQDEEEIAWNVPEGRVSYIEIYPNEPVKVEALGFSIANFLKEQIYFENEDEFVYSNKDFGIAFEVDENKVRKITLFPSNSYKSLMCENSGFKEFYSTKSWFGNSKLKDRVVINCYVASVSTLTLSKSEISVEYDNSKSDKVYFLEDGQISVSTVADNPGGDVLTYHYTVSAGKIIGSGAKVIWDLSGVKPGTYTITAGVDDGCGICGKTETKTVSIKNVAIAPQNKN